MADSLKAALVTIRSNFSTGLYSVCVVRRLTPEKVAAGNRVIIGEDGLHCVPQGEQVPDGAGDFYEVSFAGSLDFNIDRAAMEFGKMLLRNFTLDSLEAVKRYCVETNQIEPLHREGSYQFARMMRNALTHTQRWHFSEHDKRRLPVTWRDKTIDAAMEGTEPNFEFYGWWDGCELWQEMHHFADSLT